MSIDLDWQERTCKETALGLYEMELPVTLCHGERPLASHWPYYTYSAEEIKYEFDCCPDLNVGLVLGRRSGLMEVVTGRGDGNESEREFHDLVDGEFLLTPTFTSRYGYHRIFELDQRLEVLCEWQLNYETISIRIGSPQYSIPSILPPSITHGVPREWLLHFDDCYGCFERLPYCAVDRILEYHSDGGSELCIAEMCPC